MLKLSSGIGAGPWTKYKLIEVPVVKYIVYASTYIKVTRFTIKFIYSCDVKTRCDKRINVHINIIYIYI